MKSMLWRNAGTSACGLLLAGLSDCQCPTGAEDEDIYSGGLTV